MKLWSQALAGAVLTAMVFIPRSFEVKQAQMPVIEASPVSTLKLERAMPEVEAMPSRSPITAFAGADKPLRGIKICVDPGHGGQLAWDKVAYCGGTRGCVTGQTEGDVNLRVSLILREFLMRLGADVVMTREVEDRCTRGGKTEELDYRCNLANAKKCDMFISVHHNEGTNRDTNYTAVFYPSGTHGSITLAECISNSVSYALKTQNIGAKPGKYRVLSGAKMPAVIVEASFMSNPAEDQRLQSLSYNKDEARAILVGICNYVRLTKNRQFDYQTLLAAVDDKAHMAQQMADATLVRRQVIERRSMFGVKYEEITTDGTGKVIAKREVGNNSLKSQQSAKKSSSSTSKSVKVADAGSSKKSSSTKTVSNSKIQKVKSATIK